MSTMTKRVLPADVFDALEFSALVFGGIGAGRFTEGGGLMAARNGTAAPICAHGYACFLDGWTDFGCARALSRVSIGVPANDDAVAHLNGQRGRDSGSRISFADWCRELGVERGE